VLLGSMNGTIVSGISGPKVGFFMIKNLPYRTSIKINPFLYYEIKKVVSLVIDGFKREEILEKIISENIFQVKSAARKKEIASGLFKRLDILDDFLMRQIHSADVETSKLIVFYSILKTDRLFFEFMDEVMKEKYLLHEKTLTDKDFNIFFFRKSEESEVVRKWTEYTFYKLQQVMIRVLFEVGIIKNQKGDRELADLFLNQDVKNYLIEIGDEHFVHLLVGE
jgi:hypothetical protein